ncbi:MAG: 5-(carboxyamino)imidazole ribonucleotide mutase [Lachnospiraceae bacterium]|jgi:5-(carboxyamino)imidazole ribonucleotide mutase|nr:5-(carboxyamino)imidazole ribonucleotide mutase [Lachnospiraceae bacterium]MEE3460702.1 5-(carboxyamino)imidazole ribonucleotide mutase [Lachnospiraceae bacterium]
MAAVGILMGSDSDLKIMNKAAKQLEEFGIDYEMNVISAHREPDVFIDYASKAEERGVKVIIAGAGGAAHLPGMCAAIFNLPVIGVPIYTKSVGGVDSLYSIVQMPSGIPVATVAIDGAKNAAILAAKILAVSDKELEKKLVDYKKSLKDQVVKKNEKLNKLGADKYIEQQ